MQHISPQEKEIMKVVWDAGDNYPTTRDIVAHLSSLDGIERKVSSIMTVIARLVDKGFLEPVKKFRKSTYFMPLITETEYKVYATKRFVDGIHNGNLSSLVSSLLSVDKYTRNEINELRTLLDKEDV